jgi:hypothetical protein
MDLVVVVFLVDIFNFVNGIEFNLANTLLVVHLDLVDLSIALVNLVPLQVHLCGVFTFHGLDFLIMLATLHVHLLVEVLFVLIFLSLKRLEFGCVFEHK